MKLNLDDFARELTANRSRNQELSPGIRAAICTLVAAGKSERFVAGLFRVSPSTVHYAIEHWKKHHTFDSKPRSGRPQSLTRKEKRYIVMLVKRNRTLAKKALINTIGKRIPLSKEVAKDRRCSPTSVLARTTPQIRPCGCSVSLPRSSISSSSTSGTT
ncbi:hypothetical protein VTK56DRAFT_684 [Thermocarpiscus australiensis]